MFNLLRVVSIAAIALTLSACGSSSLLKDGDRAGVEDQSQGGAEAMGAGRGALSGSEFSDPANPLSHRVIYFEFDSSEVTPEGRDILAAHAAYLAAHPTQKMVLEGHADERGSREYNIALGERRALSARSLLMFSGAAESQLQTVSYGEEKPAVEGHDEASWQLNRRVELVYGERR